MEAASDQRGWGQPRRTEGSGNATGAAKPCVPCGLRSDSPLAQEMETPSPEPAMAQKYWIAIVFWAIGFALMILYEVVGLIWRS